jgi:transcriptional regulator with XRE-family HTH domain
MDGASQIDRDIGQRVRRLRDGAGMTLEALAEKSGVSRAMLSRIERGESSPTAQLLNRVVAGLGVTLSSLFASAEEAPAPVSRAATQATWRDPDTGYQRRAISPQGTGAAAEIVEIDFPGGAEVSFGPNAAIVDQQIWILAGEMELTVGETAWRLAHGDCLHMRLDRPIRFRNPTQQAARYAVVISRGAR